MRYRALVTQTNQKTKPSDVKKRLFLVFVAILAHLMGPFVLCGTTGVAKKDDYTLYVGQGDRSHLRGYAMIELHEEYLVDEQGNRKAVVISISEWQQVVQMLEELDDIRAYDEAKSQPSEAIPFEQAVSEIRQGMSD